METYNESNFESKICTSIVTNNVHLHMAQPVTVGFDFSDVKNLYCNVMEFSEFFLISLVGDQYKRM